MYNNVLASMVIPLYINVFITQDEILWIMAYHN